MYQKHNKDYHCAGKWSGTPGAGEPCINWLCNTRLPPSRCNIIASSHFTLPRHSHHSPVIMFLTSLSNQPMARQLHPGVRVHISIAHLSWGRHVLLVHRKGGQRKCSHTFILLSILDVFNDVAITRKDMKTADLNFPTPLLLFWIKMWLN